MFEYILLELLLVFLSNKKFEKVSVENLIFFA